MLYNARKKKELLGILLKRTTKVAIRREEVEFWAMTFVLTFLPPCIANFYLKKNNTVGFLFLLYSRVF